MILNVTKYTGYIRVVNENDSLSHNVVGSDAKLLGWGRESYAIRYGDRVYIYDPTGKEISSFGVIREWMDLHWDGAHLTYVYDNCQGTLDKYGSKVDWRAL